MDEDQSYLQGYNNALQDVDIPVIVTETCLYGKELVSKWFLLALVLMFTIATADITFAALSIPSGFGTFEDMQTASVHNMRKHITVVVLPALTAIASFAFGSNLVKTGIQAVSSTITEDMQEVQSTPTLDRVQTWNDKSWIWASITIFCTVYCTNCPHHHFTVAISFKIYSSARLMKSNRLFTVIFFVVETSLIYTLGIVAYITFEGDEFSTTTDVQTLLMGAVVQLPIKFYTSGPETVQYANPEPARPCAAVRRIFKFGNKSLPTDGQLSTIRADPIAVHVATHTISVPALAEAPSADAADDTSNEARATVTRSTRGGTMLFGHFPRTLPVVIGDVDNLCHFSRRLTPATGGESGAPVDCSMHGNEYLCVPSSRSTKAHPTHAVLESDTWGERSTARPRARNMFASRKREVVSSRQENYRVNNAPLRRPRRLTESGLCFVARSSCVTRGSILSKLSTGSGDVEGERVARANGMQEELADAGARPLDLKPMPANQRAREFGKWWSQRKGSNAAAIRQLETKQLQIKEPRGAGGVTGNLGTYRRCKRRMGSSLGASGALQLWRRCPSCTRGVEVALRLSGAGLEDSTGRNGGHEGTRSESLATVAVGGPLPLLPWWHQGVGVSIQGSPPEVIDPTEQIWRPTTPAVCQSTT
ncbi:hypothetical protein DENSPDRAFT_855298 [Dentipellis sp. KUC8613]|nr:hypothetical protein DENSPDRAFT_855298 [Dentipellis sp. KUC8613]